MTRLALRMLVVVGALAPASCKSGQRTGWRTDLRPDDAAMLAAECLPGAVPDGEYLPARELSWKLADPRPATYPEWAPRFRFHLDVRWRNEDRTRLESLSVRALGLPEDRTQENAARYRTAVECVLGHEAVPSEVRRRLLALLDGAGARSFTSTRYAGFDLYANTRVRKDEFAAGATIAYTGPWRR